MKTVITISVLISATIFVIGCAGMKVIHPNDVNKNEGTQALDISDGKLKLVATYTCKLKSMGNQFSAVAKTEEEARKEVVAKCRDRTLISNCDINKTTCIKN